MANISQKKRIQRIIAEKEAGVTGGTPAVGKDVKEAVAAYNQLNSLGKQFSEEIKDQSSIVKGITGSTRKQAEIAALVKDLKENEKDLTKKELESLKEVVKLKEKELEVTKETGAAFDRLFPNFGSSIGAVAQGFKDIGRLLTAMPFGLVALFAGLVMIAMRFAKAINETRAQFGMSAKDAAKLTINLKKAQIAAKAFGLSAEQVQESFNVVSQKFGDIGPQAVQFSVDMARTARNTGLGVEHTAELVSLYSALPGMSKRLSLNMIDTVTSMAEAAGVSRGILMKELAGQADLFASFVGKGEENLIKAAAAAKKVGMEFGGLVELGDGLLDVTERINKEQMLSTILGRQISLERFAQLNAAGELEAAQQELANQLQGINELSAQQTRFFSEQLGVATSDLVRLTGLRGDMPRAGGAFQNEEQKQTGLMSQISDNTGEAAKWLKREFGN